MDGDVLRDFSLTVYDDICEQIPELFKKEKLYFLSYFGRYGMKIEGGKSLIWDETSRDAYVFQGKAVERVSSKKVNELGKLDNINIADISITEEDLCDLESVDYKIFFNRIEKFRSLMPLKDIVLNKIDCRLLGVAYDTYQIYLNKYVENRFEPQFGRKSEDCYPDATYKFSVKLKNNEFTFFFSTDKQHISYFIKNEPDMFGRCLLKEITEEFPDLLTLNMVDEIHIKSGYVFSMVYGNDICGECFFSDNDKENSYLFEGNYVNINKRDFLLREINDYSFKLRKYRRNKKFADSIVLNDDFVDKKENGRINNIYLLAVSVNDDLVYKNDGGLLRTQNDDGDVYFLGSVARYEFNFLRKDNISVFCGCCNERAEELANLLSNPCNIYKHLHRHFPELFSRESIEEISVSLYYTMYMSGNSVAFIRNDKKEAYLLKDEKLIYDDHVTIIKYIRQEGFFGNNFHLYNENDINRNKWTSKDSFVEKIKKFY